MEKTWTASEGSVLATELEVKRARAISDMLVRPIAILPSEPGAPIRPFAIGLFHQIKSLLKPGLTTSKLRRTTASYVHSKRYYMACAQVDASRYDLSGFAVCAMSHEDRTSAERNILELEAAHAASSKLVLPQAADKTSVIRGGLLPRRSADTARSASSGRD